jgi:hypothetical protein
MTHLPNLTQRRLAGAIALATAISDMGAISSVNLLKNAIPVEQAQELVKIMQSKEKLATLCGLSGNEATLDFSNFVRFERGLEPGDAVLIANDISDMGALTKFDISKNDLRAEGGMLLAVGLKGNQVITELNIGSNALCSGPGGYTDTSGVVAIADVIGDMGAILLMDMSSNELGQDGVLSICNGFLCRYCAFW